MGDHSFVTRESLLSRLRRNPDDPTAWEEFVARYGPKIRSWCSYWRLQESDAEDVTQMVLVRIAAKMRTFQYDASLSFRAWLKTLTRRAWYDFITERQRKMVGHSVDDLDVLQTAEAREDLENRLAEAFDLELLEIATARVQQRTQTQTWLAFELTAIEGYSGADAAAKLETNVAAVYKAKSNVQKMLRDEIASLDQD